MRVEWYFTWFSAVVLLVFAARWRAFCILFNTNITHEDGCRLRFERMAWWVICSAVTATRSILRVLLARLACRRSPHHHWSLQYELFNVVAKEIVNFGEEVLWANPRNNYEALRLVGDFIPKATLSRTCAGLGVTTERVFPNPSHPDLVSLIMHTNASTNHDHMSVDDDSDACWVLYLHGGGYTVNSAFNVVPLVANILKTVERRAPLDRRGSTHAYALIVGYSLAPERPFPAGLNDALSAYRWLVDERSVDPAQICFVGDSAGAGLALSLALRVQQTQTEGGTREQQQHHPPLSLPACVMCLSPMLDCRYRDAKYDPICAAFDNLQPKLVIGCARSYLGGFPRAGESVEATVARESVHYDSCLASPVLATDDQLRSLPPVLMHTGTLEIFIHEAREFAARCAKLREQEEELHPGHCGWRIQLSEWEEMTHCFHGHDGPLARNAMDECADFLNEHINH